MDSRSQALHHLLDHISNRHFLLFPLHENFFIQDSRVANRFAVQTKALRIKNIPFDNSKPPPRRIATVETRELSITIQIANQPMPAD